MKTISPSLKYLLPLTVIAFLFSFCHFNPSIETGLDPSYAFGLNYIFAHHFAFGTDIIYTYGPLGFLHFPQDIGNNFLIAVLIVSALRFLFIYSFLLLGRTINKEQWLAATFLAIFIGNYLSYLDLILVGATTICILLHHQNLQNVWLVIAALLTIIALLIKSSFGLMSVSILFSYSVFEIVKNKNYRSATILIASSVFIFLMIWLLLYGNINGVYNYFYGTWQLSKGNSSAMIIEVKNNWMLIILFAVCFFSLPFFIKNKNISLLYIVSFLSLYAAWKYAFSREENYHLKFFFDYLIVFSVLILLIAQHLKYGHIALLLASLFIFHKSMEATEMYTIDDSIEFSGIKNFTDLVFDNKQFMEDAKNRTQQNLEKKKLNPQLKQLIGNATIDFFPWELTYVAANNLNWKPRPNLQSGAYTPWLDKNNANFIASKNAPQFYLWEMEKPNGGVDCFDGRYLLNDEPYTIFQLMNNYKIVYSDSTQTLFQRRDKLAFSMIIEGEQLKDVWNKWIKIPTDSNNVIRIKALLKNNFIGSLRKAIYKDIIYFMDYKLSDNTEKTYRIVRENAINGLWVSPLIESINKGFAGKKVEAIRFRSSNNELVNDSISIQWQIITLAENQHTSKNDKQ